MSERVLGLAAALGRGYVRLIGATTRFRIEGGERIQRFRASGAPVILAIWHNRLLGGVFVHRGEGIGVVISQSRDGELISRVVGGLGYVSLRGSSSRGGAQALRAVVRHIRCGGDVAFTPDGPRGPRYTVQPGVSYLARKTGHPVIPLGVSMSKKWVVNSWDRFQVPLPLGTVRICYGEPLSFDADDSEAVVTESIRAALAEATEEADARLGVRSP